MPIYEQIVTQVIFAVAGGDLAPGDLVPSVRELAAELVVNPNTVARAFQELERDGVLESRRGIGMAVAGEARSACLARRKKIVRDKLRDALREAAAAGLSAGDVCSMVRDDWPTSKS